ncbi:hypothetical protein L210DRAFT_930220 [Boletus edulis BED1]|uniref:Uncharacterized protein n=1 Tax=Boletus edulis BED1 TaxID=1328754 RepID=A0AAD4C0E4_BOLED|nr:hypothetical protein L210DRAFT_930220 [Boletus edulis BED1]
MDSQSTESIKMVMTEKEAKAKVKGVVMKFNDTRIWIYWGRRGISMTQPMKDALENLIRAMYAVKDHSKATAKAWIKNGQHIYPLADLADMLLASNLQGSDIKVKVKTVEEPIDYKQEPAYLDLGKQLMGTDFENLPLEKSGKEIVQYLDTLLQYVWTVAISGSSSKDNNVFIPDLTLPQTADITILDSSAPQSSQQGDVLSSPPLETQSMNEEPEDNESTGDYHTRHTKHESVHYSSAAYWVIQNMYWISMDMGNSTKAKEATTSVHHILTTFPKLPT